MNSIRIRIILLMFLALSVVGGFGYMTAISHFRYIELNREVLDSSYFVNLTKTLHRSSFKESTLNLMKEYRSRLHSKVRMEAMSDIIQSYADRNTKLIRKRARYFAKKEIQYIKNVRQRIQYLEKKIHLYGSISLGCAVLFMIIIFIYIQVSTFGPLRDLFHKMIEFLNNRYTYQFTVPKPNEIGNLNATFNALAQRVISNIEELKSLDRAKSDFLSIASHELRTPLTSIKGSLSLLKSGIIGEFNPQATHLTTIAETEADRLIRLVNEILDLAKIEARKFPLNKDWHSLHDLVNKTFEAIAGFSQTAGVQITCNGLLDVDLYMDQNRIQQVLTNLLSNAIKYSPKHTPVTVSCHVKQDRLVIEVTDQGKGIAPEDQELIFEKFRQTTGPDNPLVKGTGLGLTIAKAIVEEHGGYIGLNSTPDHGCTFYFVLPQWRFNKEKSKDKPVWVFKETFKDKEAA